MSSTEQEQLIKELKGKGHTDVYARAFAAKAHEGELFAHHFALLR